MAGFYDTIDKIGDTTKENNGYELWKKALENVTPSVEVKSRRIGGSNFQIPMEVRPVRKIFLSMKWLIDYASERNGKSMSDKLAAEIIA
ncbi:MAG: 30S ribosomal protein S7, partial [Bacteroidota bacterium]